MRKKPTKWLIVTIILLFQVLSTTAQAVSAPEYAKIGLYYGSSALYSANLENSVGYGYQLGYFDDNAHFISLATTSQTKLTMIPTRTMYMKSGEYSTTSMGDGQTVIGCYHVQVPQTYATFEEAQSGASSYLGGFVAWIEGEYSVRVGAYTTKAEAEASQSELLANGGTVVGTSSYGIHVVARETGQIQFQFDGGQSLGLGIQPGLENGIKPITWFKGYKYYGGFRYQRLDGGLIQVVNILPLEDYINCVVSCEMSESFPLEALKAQAVAARTYYVSNSDNHCKYDFDLCATTCCQAYTGTSRTGTKTQLAAEETAGVLAWYNGELISTYYYSSNGGATESIGNVWGGETPGYLVGKIDPYEELVADENYRDSWVITFTKNELTTLLNGKGYINTGIVDFRVVEYSPTGNVLAITFTDSSGTKWTFSKSSVQTLLRLYSIRFDISDGGKFYVDDASTYLNSAIGSYAIDGTGNVVKVSGGTGDPYVITGDGTSILTSDGDTFTLNGKGWGHNIGMSQYGAKAMAELGYTYEDILKFYYTGIDVKP